MADVFSTTTTQGTFLPDIWSKEMIIQRESVLVMANLVWRFDMDVASYGDIIHVPTVTNLTASAISTADGQLDAQSPTETQKTITINQWIGARMKVLDIVLAQSKYPFRKLYTEKMGYALGVQLEDTLLSNAPSAAANVGTYQTNFADADLRLAVQNLDSARVPFEDRHLVISPAQKNNILGIDKFIRYDATGSDRLVNVGRVPGELYGVVTHVTPEVYVSSGNTSNLMFHKQFLGLAMQKDIKVESFARVGFLDDFGASQLYGYSVMRSDHAVEVRS